jgi:hypothetical protein
MLNINSIFLGSFISFPITIVESNNNAIASFFILIPPDVLFIDL